MAHFFKRTDSFSFNKSNLLAALPLPLPLPRPMQRLAMNNKNHQTTSSSTCSTTGTAAAAAAAAATAKRRRKVPSTTTTSTCHSHLFADETNNDGHVHFSLGEPTVHWIHDHVRPEEAAAVWFTMEYLHLARRNEIKNNLRAQFYTQQSTASSLDSSNSTSNTSTYQQSHQHSHQQSQVESDTRTWRGLEDVLDGCNRTEKAAAHAQNVVRKYRSLTTSKSKQRRRNHKATAAAALSRYCKALTKTDRRTAYQLALQDQAFVFGLSVVVDTHSKSNTNSTKQHPALSRSLLERWCPSHRRSSGRSSLNSSSSRSSRSMVTQ